MTTEAGLFDFLNIPPSKRRSLAINSWLKRIRRHFYFFVFLSIIAHLALLGMVVILGPGEETTASPDVLQAQDFRLFQELLQEYAVNGYMPERFANALTALSERDIYDAFLKAPELDNRLTVREKAGLYKMMIAEGMAEFKAGTGERSALDLPISQYFKSLRQVPLTDPSINFSLIKIDNALDESARLFKLSKETARTIESLNALTGKPKGFPKEVKLQDDDGYILSVPGEYFYRDSPYLQIAAMGAKLFYINKGFPAFPAAKASLDKNDVLSQLNQNRASLLEPSPRFKVVFLPSPPKNSPAPPTLAQPILVLSLEREERVLNSLMAYPMAEQVRIFYSDFLQAYDPDSPDLARLTESFIYMNLGMVFVLTNDPLSRGFDLLEELYYDNLSFAALVPYALEHPESRTGAAILLCLGASYEFERRVILSVDESLGVVKKVLADPSDDSVFVHNKSVKAYVLREVYRDFASELRNNNFASLASVLQKYRNEQIAIYDSLAGVEGDVGQRAQYALGRYYWDEGLTDLAVDAWKSMDPQYSTLILTKIRNARVNRSIPDQIAAEINDILDSESASERAKLLERIREFNKWEKR